MIEAEVSIDIADSTAADTNIGFQQYILSQGRFDLASKVTVTVLPANVGIALGTLKTYEPNKEMYVYAGRDQTTLQRFASDQANLVHLSPTNPRRNLQVKYIRILLKIPEVPEQTIVEPIPSTQISIEEAMFLLRIRRVLLEDYFIPNSDVAFATISHGVTYYVEEKNGLVSIWIARSSPAVKTVIESYGTARELFVPFVKDFVRQRLYPHIKDYVPSSTREGRDALYRRLIENRELYRIEESEQGDVEALLADYLSGKTNLGEVLKASSRRASTQWQQVRRDQMGSVEQEIPDIIDSTEAAEPRNEYEAAPPIMREEMASPMKVLSVETKYAELNDFQLFLGLSDRLFRTEKEFLRLPHTTKLIWGAHRVIYIFTDPTGALSLYYDIELKEPLESETTGGKLVPTTTIFTANRIYVPVPVELESAFRITEGAKEFFVRFDTIP